MRPIHRSWPKLPRKSFISSLHHLRQHPPLRAGLMASTIAPPEVTARHTFRYKPFADDQSIRILTLYPGAPGSELCGKLAVEKLASAPSYECISYVWGTGARCAELFLEDDDSEGKLVLPLTESIFDALKRLRWADRPRRLWADQICINQADIDERSQQVSLMNAIYKGAEKVLVWLGQDAEGVAREAVEWVKHLDGVFADDEGRREFRRQHSEHLAKQSQEPWIPLSKLTKQNWFTRIWIVQEIGTSTPATLFWGDAEIDWDELSHVALVLNTDFHLLRTRFSIFTPNIRYLHRRFVEPENADWDDDFNRGNFVYELHRARHMRTKDPRDHVYAFLGHFSIVKGGTALTEMKPDYSRPLADVYTDVAVRALNGAKTLILLSSCHCGLPLTRTSRIRRQPVELPTWVPDWRALPLHLIGSPQTPHRAAGDTKPRLDIDESNGILHIVGRRIDTTVRRGWTFHGNAFELRNRGQDRQLPFEALWRKICRHSRYTLNTKYVGGQESAFFALVQTLSNACIGADRSRQYDTVPKEEWLANGAAYLVRAKQIHSGSSQAVASDDITREIRELAHQGDAFKWSHEATLVTRYRRFAVTNKGYYLLGPDSLGENDVLVLLYGGRTPFLIRPRPNGDGWNLLGECYVHGLMNGEGMDLGEDEVFAIH